MCFRKIPREPGLRRLDTQRRCLAGGWTHRSGAELGQGAGGSRLAFIHIQMEVKNRSQAKISIGKQTEWKD
jgi:hypothetical protein